METDEKYDIFHTWNIRKANHTSTDFNYEIDENCVEMTDSEYGSEFWEDNDPPQEQ